MSKQPEFPLLDAILLTPEDAADGSLAICTNTMAPGQVYGELDQEAAGAVSVLGSLKVSRDGAERMIINSLVHPTVQDIILFGTETSSFRPSSNLLLALQYGIDVQNAQRIVNGHNSNAQYPNIKVEHLDAFRSSVRVLPIFMSETNGTAEIVRNYLEWLEPQVDRSTYELLQQINNKPNKIYFDKLNQLITNVGGAATREKITLALNAEDFQHLQPPVEVLDDSNEKVDAPYAVTAIGSEIKVAIRLEDENISLSSTDSFLLGYSIMKVLGERKTQLTPLQQLALGAEVARVRIAINNNVNTEAYTSTTGEFSETNTYNTEANTRLRADKEYYYMIGQKDGLVSVQCMAHDQCENVFELRSGSVSSLLRRLATDNRFEDYDQDFLHRFDVGMQIAGAAIATEKGYEFVQDFDNIFEINTSKLPFVMAEGGDFLQVHHDLLQRIYTTGITAEHADRQKGLARIVAALAVFRNSQECFATMPQIYRLASQSTEQMRADYAAQLLRFDHDGSYSYGERTRSYFGYDQIDAAVESLKTSPAKAFIMQRYDPIHDMEYGIDEDGRAFSSEDPCLTHDVYFIQNGSLQCFHIARAHNTVNAYPENLFGLHDAYDTAIAEKLGVPLGDTFMLSSRANVLLLTEEQKAKKLISTPVKPVDDTLVKTSGPFALGENVNLPDVENGVFFQTKPLELVAERPYDSLLDSIEDMHGVNTLQRAIDYLRQKGAGHNNPILMSYRPNAQDSENVTERHLAFFQANVVGEKLYATAVYTNSGTAHYRHDVELANYLATQYAKQLNVELGELTFFSIGEVNE